MTQDQIVDALTVDFDPANTPFTLSVSPGVTPAVYPNSIHRQKDDFLFIGREGTEKCLFIVFLGASRSVAVKFGGDTILSGAADDAISVLRCPLNHHNATAIQQLFPFTRPALIGSQNSFGLGDRLGLANPAHLRAVAGTDIKPVLAQQSIRELTRIGRSPEDVMDAAVWAVFQEAYTGEFGADADHLKTINDIDFMIKAGFVMFTFDPGDYVVNEADFLPLEKLKVRAKELPWDELRDSFDACVDRYVNTTIRLSDEFILQPSRDDVLRALTKYGQVIAHTLKMYKHLENVCRDRPFEVELSVDETESVTQPFEHYLVANELTRLGVTLVSLAPRFVGYFEKGIDYRGDLGVFKEEFRKHLAIAKQMGGYKISLHSGSDKFSVYEVIGSLKTEGNFHVKTAGTSYLEALRTVARVEPGLFREILGFSRGVYHSEKATYHVSAHVDSVPHGGECDDENLMALFARNDARQVLHVAFGKVLTARVENGDFLFRDRIVNCLKANEDIHYAFLIEHIRKHITPLVDESLHG